MNPFHGRHFQGEIILWAVRWYCKYGISYRELQEMLAERGVNVDHTTIYRWVQRYAPEIEKRLRWYWRNPTDLSSWHIDETYVKVNGRWSYLYRAVDQRGDTIDFYLSSRRNTKSAYCFLGKILNNVKKSMQTWQSSIFGFPNMFIGIVAFAIIITTGMALISGAVFARWYWIGLQLGVTLGFAFATWLWSQALYSIHVLCPLCMVVWAVMIPLFIWLTIRNIMQGAIKVPAQVARFVGPAGWLLVAVIYLGVAASIFFAFSHVFLNTPTL